jgi:hypothetical protein
MKIGQIPEVSFFLLKTVHFSPVSNPSFWILTILGGIFFLGGNLGKHEVVLLLLLIGISHRFMPAINATRSLPDSSSPLSLSHYAQLLPINNRTFFLAFLLSSTLYVVLLLSLCIYIGTIRETPPMIASMCPPQTITGKAPSGEPLVIVEGIIMYSISSHVRPEPFQFKVPVNYSLLFGMLASDVIIDHHKIADSIMQRLCPIPPTIRSPSEVFSFNVNNVPQLKNYSTFLHNLNSVHFGRLVAIACFICLVFLIDATRRYWGTAAQGRFEGIFKWIDYTCYTMYALLCLLLLLDVLLPELIITRLSLIMNMLRMPIGIFFFSIGIAGVIRILYVALSRRIWREA